MQGGRRRAGDGLVGIGAIVNPGARHVSLSVHSLVVTRAPQCLTVLLPIRPEREAALRALLRAIGDDITGKDLSAGSTRPHIAFVRSHRIHFARLAILNDPDRGANRSRLLYTSIFDGTLGAHLDELVSITSDMDAIWGACEGYAGSREFASLMRSHAQELAAYYIAFRDESVESIKSAIERRRQRHAIQDGGGSSVRVLSRGHRESLAVRVLRAVPVVVDVVRAVFRTGPGNVYRGTSRIVASLDRYPLFRVFNRITRNRIPPLMSRHSSLVLDQRAPFAPVVPGDEIPTRAMSGSPARREDAVAQNQLTVVTAIDPARLDRVRAVMAAIDSYARRLAPPGSLIGISTIHFGRWLVIDDGRRLLFVSDYDGSWESYIDEFAEMILTGLDAIWETSFGMPPDGARDLPAFKRFLRSHQVPSDVFFAAYPDETVLNVALDRAQ